MLLAVEIVKQRVQASSDVPTPLQCTLLSDAGDSRKKKVSDCQADTSVSRKMWGGVGWSGVKRGDVG